MRLVDIKFDDMDELDPIFTLKKLYDVTGNCLENGYLGEEFTTFNFDENHTLEYATHCERRGSIIDSRGASLLDSVLIKQTKTSDELTSYYLYSWDSNKNVYAVLTVESEDYLNRYYDQMKKMNVNLCDGDISLNFEKMGLTFDGVNRVLLNQTVNPMDSMFEDIDNSIEDEISYRK